MAKRKYQTGIELLQSTNIDSVTAGYLGLGAKSDGFYIKTSAGVEGKVWHSANDGAGSGLDADLLDGQHGSYYAPLASLSGTADYIPKFASNNAINNSVLKFVNTNSLDYSNVYANRKFFATSGVSDLLLFAHKKYTVVATHGGITLDTTKLFDGSANTAVGIVNFNTPLIVDVQGFDTHTSYTSFFIMGWRDDSTTQYGACLIDYTIEILGRDDNIWYTVVNQVGAADYTPKTWTFTPPGGLYYKGIRITITNMTSGTQAGSQIYLTEFGLRLTSGVPPWEGVGAVGIGGGNIYGSLTTTEQFISTKAIGTAPLIVASTTLVSNLNADLLDGNHGSFYLDYNNLNNKPTVFPPSSHNHDDRYFTETESDARYAPIVHNHDDRYYTQAEADNRYPILAGGLIPNAYLPSYVDDVIEVANNPSLPAQGESGKIYVTVDDNKTYRWSGSYYVEISASLALGETSSTAYRGDRGKIAYDHSQILGGVGVHISDTERTNWNLAYGWGNHSGLYQPVDADLTAIAALNTTGYLRRTGAGAWQLDSTAGGDNYEGWNILVNTVSMSYIPSKNTATTYAGGLNLIAGNNMSLTPASAANNRLQITFDTYVSSNMVTLSGDISLSINAWTDALTISLPSSGTYWVEAKMFVAITGNTTVFFRLAIGTTYYDYTVLPSEAPTGTGTGTNTATLMALLSVSGASTLKVQYYTANSGITLKSSQTIGGVTATGLTKLGYLKTY